ncbi:hypothetical protein [Kitasatospora sp. HPMI-4]|uniref:hypothetical protein n=1 Tax=Kitasatospora sp. HPMI-4 TaxID=3448443 RepID=UPI003F1D2F98
MNIASRLRTTALATITALASFGLTLPLAGTAHAGTVPGCRTDKYYFEVDDAALTRAEGAFIQVNITACWDNNGQLASGTTATVQAATKGAAATLYDVSVASTNMWTTASSEATYYFDGNVVLKQCVITSLLPLCANDEIKLTGYADKPSTTGAAATSLNTWDWTVKRVNSDH